MIHFIWDRFNEDKNLIKHNIGISEAESAFFDSSSVTFLDIEHSTASETRYICIGKSNKEQILFVSFTYRNEKIRIISVRPANKREKAEHYY